MIISYHFTSLRLPYINGAKTTSANRNMVEKEASMENSIYDSQNINNFFLILMIVQ